MPTVTFSGVTVKSAQCTNNILNGSLQREWTFRCVTDDKSDYTALSALQGRLIKTTLATGKVSVQVYAGGTRGTLVVDGSTYTYCAIEELSAVEKYGTHLTAWEYTVKFVQDTYEGTVS